MPWVTRARGSLQRLLDGAALTTAATRSRPPAIQREYEDIAALVESIGEPAYLLGHSSTV